MPIVIDLRTERVLGQFVESDGEFVVYFDRFGRHTVSSRTVRVEVLL